GDPAAQDVGAPAVMLSCDDRYFRRFAPAMLESLARRMPGAAVVFHVVNPSTESLEDLARWRRDRRFAFGCSVERTDFTGWPDAKRLSYYAAGRFMRAHQWFRRLGRPLIVLDVDATVNTDLRVLAAEMTGYDVGLLIDPRGRGPSRDITVCFNYYNDTPAGAEYLSRTAAYIGWFLAQPAVYWLLDQTAHYAVCWRMERRGALRVRRYDFLNFPHCSFIGAK
ncbi:MAG TPA: tetratricopeptide repeat protein, partial [Azospirillaceae bacterium]|nr:tetratricopeptide repeat protein [Azospirillaceae bacterium]